MKRKPLKNAPILIRSRIDGKIVETKCSGIFALADALLAGLDGARPKGGVAMSRKKLIQLLAEVEGHVSVHSGLITFEDGTAIDLALLKDDEDSPKAILRDLLADLSDIEEKTGDESIRVCGNLDPKLIEAARKAIG